MKSTLYSRSKRQRDIALLLFSLMLSVSVYKTYSSWLKTDLYARASAEQAAGHLLEAEELYLRAQRISGFDYKQQETEDALSALRPVNELNRSLGSMAEAVDAAAKVSDVPTLTRVNEQFQALQKEYAGMDDAAKKRFADFEAEYQVEAKLGEAFTSAKGVLLKSLDTAMASKTFDQETSITYLAQIPAAYYKDDKTKKQQLAAKLKAYDQGLMDSWFKQKSISESMKETTALLRFYSSLGIQADWLQPLMESKVQSALTALLKKNDLQAFIAAAHAYESDKSLANPKSKVSSYIQTTMRGQLNLAEEWVRAGKFNEAMELYTTLSAYQNTDKEMQTLQQKRLTADPLQLLRKAVNDADAQFTHIISTKEQASSGVYAAGVLNETLVLAHLGDDLSVQKNEQKLGRKLSVKSLQWSDSLGMRKLPVLLVEAASQTRQGRYLALEADGKELHVLLDIEADGFTQDQPGRLLVQHPAGEAAGQAAVYEYQAGQYVFTGMKAEAADIVLTMLPKQKLGTLVRFQCSITAVDGSTATVWLNNEIVLLTGSMKLKPGPAVITGTYMDKARVMAGAPPQPTTAYQIQVTAAEQ